jgi:hypothetical protein
MIHGQLPGTLVLFAFAASGSVININFARHIKFSVFGVKLRLGALYGRESHATAKFLSKGIPKNLKMK